MDRKIRREIVATLLRQGRRDLARQFVGAAGVTMYDDIIAGMTTFFQRVANAASIQLQRVEGLASTKVQMKFDGQYFNFTVGGATVSLFHQIGDKKTEMRYHSVRNKRWKGGHDLPLGASADAMRFANALREQFEDALQYEAI